MRFEQELMPIIWLCDLGTEIKTSALLDFPSWYCYLNLMLLAGTLTETAQECSFCEYPVEAHTGS